MLVVLVATLVFGACSDSNDAASTAESSSSSSSSTATASSSTVTSEPSATTTSNPTATTTCPAFGGDEATKTSATGTHGTLADVRIGGHGCFDSIVFAMREAGPAAMQYTVERASPPFTEDASGRPVTVKGNAFIRVIMRDTSGYDFQNNKVSYTGPKTLPAPAGVHRIVEAKQSGDFEGVVTWIIGLDARHPFKVQVLGSPLRLVVDVGG